MSKTLWFLFLVACHAPSPAQTTDAKWSSVDADLASFTVAPQPEDASPPGSNYVVLDAAYSAIWLGTATPTATNYTLASDGTGCDYYVARGGADIAHWHRCDRAFGMCFRGCGSVVSSAYNLDASAVAEAAIECALDCNRSIPEGAFIEVADGGYVRSHNGTIQLDADGGNITFKAGGGR